jgi:hypothetical protein
LPVHQLRNLLLRILAKVYWSTVILLILCTRMCCLSGTFCHMTMPWSRGCNGYKIRIFVFLQHMYIIVCIFMNINIYFLRICGWIVDYN